VYLVSVSAHGCGGMGSATRPRGHLPYAVLSPILRCPIAGIADILAVGEVGEIMTCLRNQRRLIAVVPSALQVGAEG